ncbi:glutamic acid-rich protein-like [Helianthus annuus]|uniref:glutamic acid-rich protein-like n=1 Tax=Helianthus annuus TaxID=4232 RepID=UPI000B900464|nr:glutamic acid-rich protein-like [Helianthus annuus]
MKEAAYADELKILAGFKNTKNEWYVKESGRRRRKATPIVKESEGSSSKPKKKQKKAASMSLVDEPEEDNPVVTAEKEQVTTTTDDPFNVDVLFNADMLETWPEVVANVEQVANVEAQKDKEKVADDIEGDDVDKSTTSSSSSSDDGIDEVESRKRIQDEIEKENMLRKRKRQEKDDDDVYVPSPEHVSGSQSSPKARKKAGGRKKVVSPRIRKVNPKKSPKIVLKKKPSKESTKPPTPPHEPTSPQSPIHQSPPRQPTPQQQSSPPRLPTPPRQPSPIHQSPPPQQTLFTSQDLFGTPPLTQMQPGSSSRGLYTPQDNLMDIGNFDFANNDQLLKLEKKVEEVIVENKKLVAENKKVSDRERFLEIRVKKLEDENQVLVKKIDADQSEIDIFKVRVTELEEEKSRKDNQNEYFKLKNKELEAAKKSRNHEFYMLSKVVESMLGTSIEQKFEELQVEEIRAERQAEIERQMKDKGKGIEGSSAVTERLIVPSMVVENPEPISAISGLFEDETTLVELEGSSSDDDDGEEEEEEKEDKDEKVFSASSHSSEDGDDDDAAGGTGLRVTEGSSEQDVDNLMNDTINEESGEASGKGESSKSQIVEYSEKLFLSLDVYREILQNVNPEFRIDSEEDLESFDINQQPEYSYKYVEEADKYDRVEIEDCTDDEDVAEDTSKYPTLMEFFAEENREELRQKVAGAVKDKTFDSTQKEMEKEDRPKWFKKSHERKFKRPLKYFKRDQSVSLGDIISWGFLPQVNAYAIRREYGVQYFERLYDIMSLPSWDVDELAKVKCLDYPVRKLDVAMWGYIKFESLKEFRKWKPHHPKRV